MEKLNKQKHQEEIERSHTRGFGGSDAPLVLSFANATELNAGQSLRLKVLAGLCEPKNVMETAAMIAGHLFEDYFEKYYPMNAANPLFYPLSREVTFYDNMEYDGFNVFCHADFYIEKINLVYELKFSKLPTEEVVKTYNAQCQWYYMLGAKSVVLLIGRGTVTPFFVDNIEQIEIVKDDAIIDLLKKGLKNVSDIFLPKIKECSTMNSTESIGEVPFSVKEAARKLILLKRDEKMIASDIEKQKKTVGDYMQSFFVSKIVDEEEEAFINYVPDTVTMSFDKKKLFEAHPELIEKNYQKASKKSGYLKVDFSDNKKNSNNI